MTTNKYGQKKYTIPKKGQSGAQKESISSFEYNQELLDDLNDDGNDDSFHGYLEKNPVAMQQLLQQKKLMREKKYDQVDIQNTMTDLKNQYNQAQVNQKQAQQPNQPPPMNNPYNAQMQQPQFQQYPPPPPNQQNPEGVQLPGIIRKPIQKTPIENKKARQQENRKNDPFMMTTMDSGYNPAEKKKMQRGQQQQQDNPQIQPEPQPQENQFQPSEPPKSQGPIIERKAEINRTPKEEVEKQKAMLIPTIVAKKKDTAPQIKSQVNQSQQQPVSNVTQVPAPSSGSMQSNKNQQNEYASFLSDLSKLG